MAANGLSLVVVRCHRLEKTWLVRSRARHGVRFIVFVCDALSRGITSNRRTILRRLVGAKKSHSFRCDFCFFLQGDQIAKTESEALNFI
jgi:hypothetical protein